MAPRRRRRWPWIVAAVVLALFLLRGPLLAPLVARLAADALAEAVAGEAQVGSAGGGWFGDAHLVGIRAEAPLGVVRSLRIRSAEATYGPAMLGGDLTALRSLTLDGVEATLDLRAAGGDGDGAIPPLLELLPTPLPQASLSGEVRLILPEHEVRLSQLALRTTGDRVTLDVRVEVAGAEPLQVAAAFMRPTADTLRLERAVVLGEATVETLELVLGRRQELTAALRSGGGRCTVHADRYKARLVAEGLDLRAIPPALAALLPDGLGDLRGTAAGQVVAVRTTGAWNVSGTLRVDELVAAGLGPFTLDGQWLLAPGVVRLPRLTIDGPGSGQAVIADLEVATATRLPRAGTIRASIPDLRRWLPAMVTMPPTAVGLEADLRVEGDTYAIRTLRLAGGGVALDLRGNLTPAPWRIEAADATVRADLAGLMALWPGLPNLAGGLRLQASGTLPLSGDPGRLLSTPFELQVRGEDLVLSSVALARLRLDARTGDGVLHLTQGECELVGITVGASAAARWENGAWNGALANLAIALPGVTAEAVGPCPFLVTGDGWSFGPLRLAGAAGALTLEARQRDGSGLLALAAPAVDLARLGFTGLEGRASVDVELAGEWSAPRAQVRVVSDDLRVGTRSGRVDLHLTQDQHGIAIQRGHLAAGRDGTLRLEGTVPLVIGATGIVGVVDDGRPATITLEVPELVRWIPGRIDSGARRLGVVFGTATDPAAVAATLRYRDVRPVRAARPTLRPGIPPAALDGELVLAATAEGIALTLSGTADGRPVLSGELHSAGPWDPVALWRHPGDRPLTGRVVLDGAELGRFASAIPGLLHLSGRAQGTLAVAGTVGQPSLSGDLALSGVEAKFTEVVPTLSEGRARLELRDGTVRLHEAVADMGGEPVRVSGGLELGEVPRLDLAFVGSNALLVQRHDARLRADLDLRLTGPLDALRLNGRMVVTNALFTPDLGLFKGGGGTRGDGRLVPFELNAPPLSTLRFDVLVSSAFGAGRDGVRLATDLVRADCDLDLRLGGTGAVPELAGRVTVRKGAVFLPFSTLRLTHGELLFPEGDPFRPRINAVANAQVRRWTVVLQVDGLLSDPQVRTGGDGLDERDALLLLTTGSTSEELNLEDGQRAALGRLGTWLGAEAWDLIDGETDPDRGPGLMDRVTLQFGREVSEGGNDTIEAEVELTDPDLVPGLLLYGERDRWDDYNAGVILRFKWGGEE